MIDFKPKYIMKIIYNQVQFPRLSGAVYNTIKIKTILL